MKCKNCKLQSKDSYGQKNYIEIIVFVKISKQLRKEQRFFMSI